MGISSFTQITSEIKHDSILSWPIPINWSLEDATTVPLAYAMVIFFV